MAIVLFKTFRRYYEPSDPDLTGGDIPAALFSFIGVSLGSIVVGLGVGLMTSFLYRHTKVRVSRLCK